LISFEIFLDAGNATFTPISAKLPRAADFAEFFTHR
jgi:hypothetical protein